MCKHMNRNVRKRTFAHVRPAKTQISLCIRAVWLEFLLGAFWIYQGAKFLHMVNEDSDHIVRSEGTFSVVSAHINVH